MTDSHEEKYLQDFKKYMTRSNIQSGKLSVIKTFGTIEPVL